jgi:hypothetical protein|tara:strand:+ start:143 stop:343 length:201 start_codon:yes stop_codon:yes gene_type:complete
MNVRMCVRLRRSERVRMGVGERECEGEGRRWEKGERRKGGYGNYSGRYIYLPYFIRLSPQARTSPP